jgi:alpha-ketoglutarate-dependent taurine dioxygenase
MDIRILDNGWTIQIENFDIKNLTHKDAALITKYLLTNTVVVFKNQSLTPDDEIRIAQLFGKIENYNDSNVNENFILDNSDGFISRVTGELNDKGMPGVFGHEHELEWHCNRVSEPKRNPFVWLYSERGSRGSRTSYLNNILTYNDLSEDKKQQFANIKLNVGDVVQYTDYLCKEGSVPQDITNYRPNLVHTNPLGVTGLFFSWNQIHFIEGMSHEDGRKFIEELRQFAEQEKYMYHHDWEDGDIVIAEQNLSIHKRWEFKHMDKRVLHRITFDYSNINISKLDENN